MGIQKRLLISGRGIRNNNLWYNIGRKDRPVFQGDLIFKGVK